MTGKLGHVQKLEVLRRVILTATGQEVPTRSLISALSKHVRGAIRITPGMVQHLRDAQAQQDTINAAVRLTMRVHGPQTPYENAYPIYQERAQAEGLRPLDLKTFKNRALQEYQGKPLAPADEPGNVATLQTRNLVDQAG